jgi:signal transduction histidine kinase
MHKATEEVFLTAQPGAARIGGIAKSAAIFLCVLTLAVGLGAAVVQQVAGTHEEEGAIERRALLADHYADMLAQSLWRYDIVNLQNQLQGLLLHDDIIGARVEGDGGNISLSVGISVNSQDSGANERTIHLRRTLAVQEAMGQTIIGAASFVFRDTYKQVMFSHLIAGAQGAAAAALVVAALAGAGYVILTVRPLRRIRALVAAHADLDPTSTMTGRLALENCEDVEKIVKSALHDLKAAQEAVDAAAKATAEATQVKAAFLANVSHELRTPLNGVIGLLTLLMEQPLTTQQSGYVRAALLSAESLLTLVSDLLDTAQLAEGKAAAHLSDVNVRRMTAEIETLLTPRAAQRQNTLRCRVADETPTYLVIDEEKTRRILLNLLSNAIKFTHGGAITVGLSFVGAYDKAGLLRLEVADTGVGIPRDQLGYVFERFAQVENTATRSHDGAGLGLAICRDLCETLGGRLGADSEIGKGSLFWVELPARAATEPWPTERFAKA